MQLFECIPVTKLDRTELMYEIYHRPFGRVRTIKGLTEGKSGETVHDLVDDVLVCTKNGYTLDIEKLNMMALRDAVMVITVFREAVINLETRIER
jgi:hypothetical protein